jgi:hypothetical protein
MPVWASGRKYGLPTNILSIRKSGENRKLLETEATRLGLADCPLIAEWR